MKINRLLVAAMLGLALPVGVSGVYAAEAPQASTQRALVTVTGTVLDSSGEPVIGATVREKGNLKNGTATDVDGRYTLRVPHGAKLEISYIGCQTADVAAGQGVTTTLKEDSNVLDELVVVGFGTQKRANLTGAVSTVDTKLLNDRPVNNVATALQGAVPGLNIGISSGSLETNPSINIRGNGTIGQGSSGSPLILIDGMEGDINTLNPQDVESVSVLKDAAAASIYGSRAPFGVILITTKKGTSGKATVNYQNSFRFQSLINKAEPMDSYSFATYFNEACANTPGKAPHFDQAWLQRIYDYREGLMPANEVLVNVNGKWYSPYDGPYGGNSNDNWFDEVYKDHNFGQEHNLSISGGNEKTTYYFSGNFSDQQGMINLGKDDKKMYSVHGKFRAELYKWMTMSYSGRWTRSDYERPSALVDDLYNRLCRQAWPIIPIRDNNGYYYDGPSPALALAEGGTDTNQTDRNIHQLDFIFKPLKGWDIHAELNYSVRSSTRHWDSLQTYNHDAEGNPYLCRTSSNVHEDYYKENFFNINLFSNYDFTVAEKNDFHVMLGFQTENMKQLGYGLQRNGILISSLPVVDLTNGLDYAGEEVTPSVNGYKNEWATAGFFGRINYSYDSRYLAEVNLRYDGTSRFRSDKRWILLPSASLGWNIANEAFWEDFRSVCDQLKLRASYGVLGNQNTTNWYQTYRVIGLGMSNGGWLQDNKKPNTASFPALISELLTWEKIYNWNVGLDFALFNNRLRGSADYFVRETKDMVGPAPELPATLGASVPATNNCDLRSNGWDFELEWNDRTSFGLGYGVKAVLSDSRIKITNYPNNPSKSLSNYIEGQYTGDIWGYETIGIAKTDEEMQEHLKTADQSSLGSNWAAGDIMYKNQNPYHEWTDENGVVHSEGDNTINSGAYTLDDHGDLKVIGNNNPRWRFSLDVTADYKGFDLRVYLQGVAKRDYWQGSQYFAGALGDIWWSCGLKPHSDYFRAEDIYDEISGETLPQNLDAYYARPMFDSWKNYQTQTRYLQNAAYIRLKNLQVGYTIPKNLTKKIGFEKIRVYFSGENLATGTKLSKLFDPETIGSGWGGCAYPLSRTYSFGINVTL